MTPQLQINLCRGPGRGQVENNLCRGTYMSVQGWCGNVFWTPQKSFWNLPSCRIIMTPQLEINQCRGPGCKLKIIYVELKIIVASEASRPEHGVQLLCKKALRLWQSHISTVSWWGTFLDLALGNELLSRSSRWSPLSSYRRSTIPILVFLLMSRCSVGIVDWEGEANPDNPLTWVVSEIPDRPSKLKK